MTIGRNTSTIPVKHFRDSLEVRVSILVPVLVVVVPMPLPPVILDGTPGISSLTPTPPSTVTTNHLVLTHVHNCEIHTKFHNFLYFNCLTLTFTKPFFEILFPYHFPSVPDPLHFIEVILIKVNFSL